MDLLNSFFNFHRIIHSFLKLIEKKIKVKGLFKREVPVRHSKEHELSR